MIIHIDSVDACTVNATPRADIKTGRPTSVAGPDCRVGRPIRPRPFIGPPGRAGRRWQLNAAHRPTMCPRQRLPPPVFLSPRSVFLFLKTDSRLYNEILKYPHPYPCRLKATAAGELKNKSGTGHARSCSRADPPLFVQQHGASCSASETNLTRPALDLGVKRGNYRWVTKKSAS